MEKLLKELDVHRTSFLRIYNETVDLMMRADVDMDDAEGNLRMMDHKIEVIQELDKQLIVKMLDVASEDEVDDEMFKADELMGKYNRLKVKIERKFNKDTVSECHSNLSHCRRKINLPKIEFVKFSGEIKDWLSFWSQFERIHLDENVPDEDKYQYLIQATISKSPARRLVESYPPTAANYPKIIETLKARFGREDILIEFYIRELLKLILSNLNQKTHISHLYDQIELQLRSLDSLGITFDKCAAVLFPLVESCLSEDLLRVWQRSSDFDSTATLKLKLEKLLDFLKKEVEHEQKIAMAKSSFYLPSKNRTDINKSANNPFVPTASTLLNEKKTPKCVFCKNSHFSSDCGDEKIQKLPYDEKRKILIDNGRCYLCLKFGHLARKCAVRILCKKCNRRHATVMCNQTPENVEKILSTSNGMGNCATVETLSNSSFNEVFLQTLVVKICGHNKTRCVRALIDTGSQRSYIAKHVAVEMGYDSMMKEKIVHALFGGIFSKEVDHHCYKVLVRNIYDHYMCNFIALDQLVICNHVSSVRVGQWTAELAKLGIVISDTADGPIELLLGADVVGKLMTGKKHTLECGLVAIETKLGWTLMGRVSNLNVEVKSPCMIVTSLLSHDDISKLWSLDVLGIADPSAKKADRERETAVMNQFLETITINDEGRYEVGLTWVDGHPPLSNNFCSAKRRLDSLLRKFDKDGYYCQYDAVLKEWENDGIIEEIPMNETSGYYLPHRHVVKLSSSTTKIRPVFDASSKEQNQPSLNQCLDKGINLIELIPSLLNRFRFEKIGVISDIRKAFLQISLSKEDRNFLKFLWYDQDKNLKVYRHTRVVFGVTCSPFLLAGVINYHLKKLLEHPVKEFSRWTINKLATSFYVDNCVTSVGTKQELQQFISESTDLMSLGKFDLRLWEHNYFETGNSEFAKDNISPVLGLLWNRESDTLGIDFEWLKFSETNLVTKRLILSIAHKIFDPIGFSCPVQMCPRLLLRELWSLKLGWDEEVPEEIKGNFLKWVKDIQILKELRVPRWMAMSDVTRYSLHMFADASRDAYAAVVFLRTESTKEVTVQLVQARNRLCPTKNLTIPRLELLAATIGTRLLNSVVESIQTVGVELYCWTDSTTVLSWIRRDECWKPFVWNRVQEIKFFTNKNSWFHVPGYMNPSDLPSRGCLPKHLLYSKWWEGPEWLKSTEKWPKQNYEVCEKEIAKEKKVDVEVSSLLCSSKDLSIFYSYFSKYSKIVNEMAWIRRFIFNCRNPARKRKGMLILQEIEEGEVALLKLLQKESFEGAGDKRFSGMCIIKNCAGILTVKTKITERDDLHDFLFPILLPAKHILTEKIIFDIHSKNSHVGVQGLLCKVREKFWIPKGRQTVKKVIRKCMRCRRFDSKRMSSTSVTLPEDRVRDAALFEVVGVDLAGPLFLRNQEKIWICLFTCAVYRAVHLEMVSSLSTATFLLAFRRFIARRGRPATVYSDNGTNFVGAENCFKMIDWEQIQEESTAKRINWKFNPPSAPWWGGWWERLIGLLKQLLRKQLGNACLTSEELYTVLCDCEAVINARPLTYMSENVNELVPITPSMFMRDIKEVGVPDFDKIDTTSMNRHLRYLHKIRETLRRRFRSEYLSQLILFNRKAPMESIKVGDLVLIENENCKRLQWPLGIVEKVFIGKDGAIRLVKLRSSFGQLLRPIQRLFPLEMNVKEGHEFLECIETQVKNDFECDKRTDIQKNIPLKPINKPDQKTRSGRVVKPPDRLHF